MYRYSYTYSIVIVPGPATASPPSSPAWPKGLPGHRSPTKRIYRILDLVIYFF